MFVLHPGSRDGNRCIVSKAGWLAEIVTGENCRMKKNAPANRGVFTEFVGPIVYTMGR